MSKLQFNYDDKDYVLEYNRASLKEFERDGYVLNDVATKPVTYIPVLFTYAFKKNHKNVKQSTIDEIYESMDDKQGLLEALMEMVGEAMNSLFDTTSKNVIKWKKLK